MNRSSLTHRRCFVLVLGLGFAPLAFSQDPLPVPAEAPVKNPAPSTLPVDPNKIDAAAAKITAKEANLPPRHANWSVGFDGRELNVTPGDRRYKQRALAPDINIGFTWIDESWWAMGRVHLPFGPTSERFPDSPPLDTEGYGVSATFGKTLSSSSLRESAGDYGVELGIESFELAARSFRRQVLFDGTSTDAWVMKTRWTALTPAIFATFLKPARPQGNKPEWLMTRIEGYRVSLGVVVPVQRSWDLRYERAGVPEGDRGGWTGVHGVLSVSTWLGI